VSTDVPGAQQAFAEKLGLTYPLLSDVSRDTVKQYGVMHEDPHSAYFRLAKRAYVVIDQQGIVRHKEVMDDAGHLLDAETIVNTVKHSVTGVQ
jgi:glutaredoxin-dependent peroxiredoxin